MNHNGKNYNHIEINEMSDCFDVSKIEHIKSKFKISECVRNSYYVGKEINSKCIEGFVLLKISVDNELQGKVIRHCWNKLGDSYFDVSKEEIWNNHEYQVINALYHVVSEFEANEYSKFENCVGNLPFLSDAVQIAGELDIELKNAIDNQQLKKD